MSKFQPPPETICDRCTGKPLHAIVTCETHAVDLCEPHMRKHFDKATCRLIPVERESPTIDDRLVALDERQQRFDERQQQLKRKQEGGGGDPK